jgi:hypothetical protein
VLFAAARARGELLERAGLLLTALGAVLVGAHVVEFAHEIAMAGIHVAALGAALLALTSGVRPRWSAALWVSGVVMAGAIAFSPTLGVLRLGQLTAAAAGVLALAAALVLVRATLSASRESSAAHGP